MPRPRRTIGATSPSLSPGQAAYVIERLISERRVSPGDVNRYISEMTREISDLEERLNRLRAAHGGGTGSGGGTGTGTGTGTGARRGRPVGSGRGPGRPAGSGKRRGRPPASESAAPAGGAKRGRPAKKRSSITAEQLASRQLQGRYLALVRQFPEGRRIQFAKIAKEKGRESAIREMQDSLKK